MGIKKRLCNPVGEEVAGHGDYELCGLFKGAGRAAPVIEDKKVRRWFEDAVVKVESDYIEARNDLAEITMDKMRSLYDDLLEKVGYYSYESEGGNPTTS